MYNRIFVINLRRALKEQQLSRKKLSELSGISPSFLFDMLNGKSNPSLKTMEAVAEVLDVPLEVLLSRASVDTRELDAADSQAGISSIPQGYTSVFAVLPDHQAFMVRKWAKRSAQRLMAQKSSTQDKQDKAG